MTHRILKYTGGYGAAFVHRLPRNAKVLSVQNQFDLLTMWVQVDEGIPKDQYINRCFICFATGQLITGPEDFSYLATLQDIHGQVWHCFECLK